VNFSFVPQYLPLLAQATVLTAELAIGAFALGAVLGFLVALARIVGGADGDLLLGPVVNLIRGTPALVQILAWYLGSSALGIPLDPFTAVLVALAVNSAAFISETLRGAIRAVPKGQREAALAIGLSTTYSVIRIELPQALPAIIPALMGFFIGLVKDTSLAYLVGLYELTTTAKIIAEREFRPLEIYLVIAVIYFALCFPLSRLVPIVERRLQRSGLAQQHLSV
jgi:His/Glu/Gln/Arg/opine family amino acid ABC transporter permease subunit